MQIESKYNETLIHPVGLIAVLVLGFALVMLPRRYAVMPMIVLACFIPSAQRLVLMELDFNLLRILVLFGWTRLVIRNEFRAFSWNKLDSLVVAWMISGTVIMTLEFGTVGALINRSGWMFDGLGMYFLFRCLVRGWEDLDRLAFCFVIVSFPVAAAFLVEWMTGRNAFAVFGGVPLITHVRDGRLRCQGAFSHAILAGCFWASAMPLAMSRLASAKKLLTVSGIGASVLIVATCASSTPIMSIVFGLVGMAMFLVRKQLYVVRWGLLVCLTVLHFTMEKPVWYLVARVNVISSSTGWHRYRIMDATINNFSEWWMLGDSNPLSWGERRMSDVTNQYIMQALQGGLLTLVLFIATIAVAFGIVGKVLRQVDGRPLRRIMVWCIGVTLFVHVCTFFAVSYFGQIMMLFYLSLAMVGSLPGMCATSMKAPAFAGSGPVGAQKPGFT